MKLNHDCMRDCLLYIESIENVQIDQDEDDISISLDPTFIEAVFAELEGFSRKDVFYAIFNLDQAGYINTSIDPEAVKGLDNICIYYLTLQGHEFLDSIRDDNRWKAVKKGLSAVRNYSLSAMSAIAEGVTAAAISAYLSQQ